MLAWLPGIGRQIENAFVRAIRAAITVTLACMVLTVAYQVFSRLTGLLPFLGGTEEVARGLFIWLVLLGASLGVRDGAHFAVDILAVESPGLKRALGIFVAVVIVTVALILLVYGWRFAQTGLARRSLATGLPAVWSYSAIFVGGGLMAVFGMRMLLAAILGWGIPTAGGRVS